MNWARKSRRAEGAGGHECCGTIVYKKGGILPGETLIKTLAEQRIKY